MHRLRSFRNADPPGLAELWRRQPPTRGLAQPLSPAVLEELVLGKPYFDPEGLIVAEGADGLAGFVHAGFGASDDRASLCHEAGVTCMLMVDPESDDSVLPAELLAASEAYLRERGARLLYAGGVDPLDPFYLGLYGGSELPGVLESDAQRLAWYRAGGYDAIDGVVVLQAELGRFRPPVNRKQMQLRRQMSVVSNDDPTWPDWWSACRYAAADCRRWELRPKGGDAVLARATLWDLQALGVGWGERTAGLVDVWVEPERRGDGLATFLLSEALKKTADETRAARVEVQTMQANAAALALYDRLGFTEIDRGVVLRKGV